MTSSKLALTSPISQGDQPTPAAETVEVAAMLGDSVVGISRCTGPRGGRATRMLAAVGIAGLLASAIAFYTAVETAARNRAALDRHTRVLKRPWHAFRPQQAGGLAGGVAVGGLALGLSALTVALVRARRARCSPVYRIGTAPGVDQPIEGAPSERYPLVAPSREGFVLNYAPGIEGELISGGAATPLSELASAGRSRPSATAPGAIEIPIPAAAWIRARAGRMTFLVSAVAGEQASVPAPPVERRAMWYAAGSLAVHLAFVSVLSQAGIADEGASIDLAAREESMTFARIATMEQAPDEGPGDAAAMVLSEGAAGARVDGKLRIKDTGDARQRAIEQARSAGILGSVQLRSSTALLGSVGNFSSGFARGAPGGAFGVGRGASGGDPGGERYRDYGTNPWTFAWKDRLSTFAADVDTASYTIMRRKLEEGSLPPRASVRVEEYVNYFTYAFPEPSAGTPFSVVIDAAPSPLSRARHILRVGVATRAKHESERKPANLVFLVDVSGSMSGPDRLDLAKKSLRILTHNLKEGDTVAIVTYAGSTRVVLGPTGAEHKAEILDAIDELASGGSTGMASGIDLAYAQATAAARPGAISRVIVLSDGDANVGPHTHDEILSRISGHVKQGVTLSTIGFGVGNYKDELMEQLANKGNGNNFYIDSIGAAKKVFEQQLTATLEVVAKDAKLQVDFDPAMVARYRLVGYENRDIKDADFRNDKVDAGEIGAGHQVTALYEVELTPHGKQVKAPIASVRIRHKAPNSDRAVEAAFPMIGGPAASFASASADFRFAFAVAAFADNLRGGEDAEHWSLGQIRDVAAEAAGGRADRTELVRLVEQAISLRGRTARL